MGPLDTLVACGKIQRSLYINYLMDMREYNFPNIEKGGTS